MNKTMLGLAAAGALLVSSGAWAQAYMGLAAGPSRIAIDCAGADTCDRTDTGFKLYAGLHVSPEIAVEAVYFEWGKANASATDAEAGIGSLEVKGTGFGIGAAYFMPLAENWTGTLRLGIAQNKGRTTADLGGPLLADTFRGSFAYAGLGIGYRLTPSLTITGEADFSRLKVTAADKAGTRLLSVGVRYAF